MKDAGQWRYVYRAIDQFGQVIDVFVSPTARCVRRPPVLRAGIRTSKVTPAEVTTDRAPVYPAVLEELLPAAWHRTDRHASNRVESDHGRLNAWLRPMRGLKQNPSARIGIVRHGFIQNLRRGHYELAVDPPANWRVAVAFDELAMAI